jgi:5-methylcytosine-specific restriction protein B
MFSWIPFYTELAQTLSDYRDRQQELIHFLQELDAEGIPVGAVRDQDASKKKIPLTVIDPFTFFSTFNRGLKEENRRKILERIKQKLHLNSAIPADFDGIPVVTALRAWFFPYKAERKDDDVSSLWDLAISVVQGTPDDLDPQVFNRCLKIKSVAPGKLTMGMFWLNPHRYIACDARNRELFARNGIECKIGNLAGYLQLLKQVNAKLGGNYAQISNQAWQLTSGDDGAEASPVAGTGTSSKQYWAGGFQWGEISKLEEFINGNIWQIGWDKNDVKQGARTTWANFEKVKVGDGFAIKGHGGKNDLKIYYLGKVKDKSDDGILHLQQIDGTLYKGKGPKGVNWFGTLVPITVKPAIDAIFHPNSPRGEAVQPSTSTFQNAGALNRILYGPPGTGKTYSTIEEAVRIADPIFAGDHAAQKRRFDEMLLEGRIEFITFHQSYSYEDFVEGIRPVLTADEENPTARYECRPGVFKRLASNALFDCLERAEDAKGLVPFDALWTALISKIDLDPEAKYLGLSSKTSYRFSLTQKGNIEGTNVLSDKTFLCSRKLLEQVFDAKRDRDSIVVADVMEVVARGCHSQLVAAVFNELRRIEKTQFAGKVQPEQKKVYTKDEKAEIVQRFLADANKGGYKLRQASLCSRYVLIIDEINRGNISKILGELITLLETDKRLGTSDEQNSLVVTLPYSGEKFAVPANLYVVGTMNTADKSIALVDVALRRRFDFEEMQVRMDLCNGLTDQMRLALTELNRRITLRKDRDHQIGHAYFIRVADIAGFNQQFRKQIIPLLQEYFYNDWDGVRYVLGETATEGRFISKVSGSDAKEARTKWQWFFDTDAGDMDCFEALCVNYEIG